MYFDDPWNNFDFTIVVGALFGFLMRAFGINIGGITTVLRTVRVCRVVKLVKSAKFLQAIIMCMLKTIPSLGNIGGLLLLFMFIFSVLGQQL